MTQRTNTVEYAFPTLNASGALADAVATALGAITVDIAENTSRTIRSAYIEVSWDDEITATGGTITEWRVECQIDAVAYSTVTETNDITHGGENLSVELGPIDFTSYFVTNFTGTSHSVNCRVYADWSTGTTLQATNVCAKLIITYEYDDAAQTTRMRTARIPIDGAAALLTATLTELGTNQIPNLDTFLPEASKSYKSIFAEIRFLEANAGTTDFQLGLQIDSGAEHLSGNHETALTSNRTCRYIWNLNSLTTSAAHAIKARSTLASRILGLSIVLVVTYSYDHSSANGHIASLAIPFHFTLPANAVSASGDSTRVRIPIWIEEPGTITLLQSGYVCTYSCFNSPGGMNFRAGAQSYAGFPGSGGSIAPPGTNSIEKRIDNASSGITLARGYNVIDIDFYHTDLTRGLGILTGILYLNYTHNKPSGGSGVANHTTLWYMARPTLAISATTYLAVASFSVPIPESNYYCNSVGLSCVSMDGADRHHLGVSVERGSSEGIGAGWTELFNDFYLHNSVKSPNFHTPSLSAGFKRYPADTDTNRVDIETARDYRIAFNAGSTLIGASMLLTYHAQTYTFSGNVTGYTGDGSGIVVEIYNAATNEKVGEATTSAGGGYTFTWYDNTANLFAEARQDGTHVGRSDNALAT